MLHLPSGAVTFLFTDIEGSTRLWEQQPQAMRDALARHDALLRDAIQSNHGRVFKTVGDAFYSVFASPQDAVQAAVEAQCALHKHLPQVRVRMALHAGAAELREGDYFGPDLNRVARLLAAGHGGQVLLSSAAVDRVRDALPEDTDVQLLGRRRLRDITVRESVYQLSIPGLAAAFPPLNTLDVAFRRGIRRTSVVLLTILVVVTGLAIAALTQARRAKRVLRAFSGVGDRIAFSPDGTSLAVNSGSSVKLWTLVTGQEVMTLTGPRATVYDVALSPDGNLVAASSADGTVRFWRATPFAETDAPAGAIGSRPTR